MELITKKIKEPIIEPNKVIIEHKYQIIIIEHFRLSKRNTRYS